MSDSTSHPPEPPDDAWSVGPTPGQGGRPSGDWPHPGQPTPRSGAPAPGPEPEGFFETLVGVITSPADTLRRVTAHPKVVWALVVLAGVGLLNGVVEAQTVEEFEADPAFREMLPPGIEEVGTVAIVTSYAAVALLGTLLGAVAVHLAARLLGGQGRFTGQFSGFGIAYFPMAFGVVAGLLGTAGAGVALLGVLLAVALFVWVLVLGVIATRENHRLSTGQAVGAVAIGAVFLAAAVVALAVLIGLLIAGLFAAMFG